MHEAAESDRKTAEAYGGLLRDLFVIDTVPAWSTNRLKRLVRSPKRYVVDPGLVAGALQLAVEAVADVEVLEGAVPAGAGLLTALNRSGLLVIEHLFDYRLPRG